MSENVLMNKSLIENNNTSVESDFRESVLY
jgi:hypothetical protein